MIILDSQATKLQAKLEAAGNLVNFFGVYADNGAAFTPGQNNVASNGGTYVDVVSAPQSGQRQVKSVYAYNGDTVPHTVTLAHYDGTMARILNIVTLAPGAAIDLIPGRGLYGAITGPTDSTLAQTGTTLGLNLANANTWTGLQTFSGGLSGALTGTASGNIPMVSPGPPGNSLISNGSAWISAAPAVYNVKDYGAKGDGVTDDDAAVQAAITAANAANGGIIYFPAGTYLISGQIRIPDDGGNIPANKSFTLRGAGDSANGIAQPPLGGTILKLSYNGTIGKIISYGSGTLHVENLTLQEPGASALPFIYVTNTVLRAQNVAFYGNKTSGWDQDCIILGGTTTTQYKGPDAPFQGYSTVIIGCWADRIRRFVVGQKFCNAVNIVNNTVFAHGGNSAGGAIELLGDHATGQIVSGNYVAGNLIETVNYLYGIRTVYGLRNTFIGNTFYDSGAFMVAGYRLEDYSSDNIIIGSYIPTAATLVSEDSNSLNQNQVQDARIASAHTEVRNNLFVGTTTFANSSGPKFRDATLGLWTVTTASNGLTFSYLPNGGSSTNWLSFGTDGTYGMLSLLAPYNRVCAPNGNLRMKCAPNEVVVLEDGNGVGLDVYLGRIRFGASRDASINSPSSGLIQIGDGGANANGTIAAKSFRLKGCTVATLPAGTQGDTAFVTDAVSPTYLGTLTGGGTVVTPVFHNGSAWVSY
jgi:hypothetical protein